MTRPLRVFISAGEASGDRIGAGLAQALRRRQPDVEVCGLGGRAMAGQGVELIEDPTAHASMGLGPALAKVGIYLRIYRRCVSHFHRHLPDVFVPIDNPEFNVRFARFARGRGVPVVYYVSPQVWAWRRRRIHAIAATVDRMLCILPFEKALYDRVGCDARYVGHPTLDYLSAARLDPKVEARIRTLSEPRIGLLPGSRAQEVRDVFPIIAGAAAMLRRRVPEARFVVGCARQGQVAPVKAVLRQAGVEAMVLAGHAWEVMRNTHFCLAASGTVTLELAWFRRPMVIVYRAPQFVRPILPWALHTRFGLVNVIAGREICPEHLNFDANPVALGTEAIRLARDEAAWTAQREALDEVIQRMGGPGSADRAAESVLEFAARRRRRRTVWPPC